MHKWFFCILGLGWDTKGHHDRAHWVCLHHKRIFKAVQFQVTKITSMAPTCNSKTGWTSKRPNANKQEDYQGYPMPSRCRDVSCTHTSQGLSTGTATYSPLCSFLITTLSQDSKGTLCRRQTGLNTENMGPDAATPRLVMFREGPPRH